MVFLLEQLSMELSWDLHMDWPFVHVLYNSGLDDT
jgi:hypothetical protein